MGYLRDIEIAEASKSYFFVHYIDYKPKIDELNKASGLSFHFDTGNYWVAEGAAHFVASTPEDDAGKLNQLRDKLKAVKHVMDVDVERGLKRLTKAGKWQDT